MPHAATLSPPDDGLFDHQGAARWLDISTGELKELVDAGELPFVILGRGRKRPRRKYRKQDLAALVERRLTWHSPAAPARHTGNTSSSSTVVDIAARLRQPTGKPPAPSRGRGATR